MSLLWRTAVEVPTYDVCSCGCGCEPDGDWHWSQQPWCPCANNGCPCVTDQKGKPLTKQASEHPTEESVQHILDHYCFDDAEPQYQHEPGRRAWQSVKDTYEHSWPGWERRRQDIRDNGVQRPIGIDYEEDPPRVRNGHTRLMLAEQVGLDKVPVKHLDRFDAHDDILSDDKDW